MRSSLTQQVVRVPVCIGVLSVYLITYSGVFLHPGYYGGYVRLFL
jgi:hypothetical protein